MPRSVKCPPALEPMVDEAEAYIARRFANVRFAPEEGTVRVDGERYVMVRAESLYVGLVEGFVRRFGPEAAVGIIYAMAWEIGQSDALTLNARMGAADHPRKLAGGPPFFAHCGWATVDLLADSSPFDEEDPFLHYYHPNTFESEALSKRGDLAVAGRACIFSAGYSAGWVSQALDKEMHAREMRCRTEGATSCEFVMSREHRLDDYARRFSGDA